ncbi:YfiR family protein [candidate division CSSED10-310 bacterium]|uniref:YfiR family protein n=1 Tax=candidate division CSSED10-310 bacterium TaxID=2855610 RepID=A0ABV6Z174_UNCC1
MKNSDYMRNILLILFMFVFSFSLISGADDSLQNTPEFSAKVKAVFIFNMLKYVQWPDDSAISSYDIVILGESSIARPLQKIAETRSVNKKPLRIRLEQNIEQIQNCHVLFISSTVEPQINGILKTLEQRHILTIGDLEGLGARGVIINFILVEGKIKFEINSQAAKRASLQLSSQLLKLAKLVHDDKG